MPRAVGGTVQAPVAYARAQHNSKGIYMVKVTPGQNGGYPLICAEMQARIAVDGTSLAKAFWESRHAEQVALQCRLSESMAVKAKANGSERGPCEARQYSDQMQCSRCGLTYDVNDPDPPDCNKRRTQFDWAAAQKINVTTTRATKC